MVNYAEILPKVRDARGFVHYFQGTDAPTGDHIPWCGIEDGAVFLFLTEGERVAASEPITCDDCACRRFTA